MNNTTILSFFWTHREGRAMLVAIVFGVLIVLIKYAAYFMSGSMAVLADVIESVIHNLVIGFAAFSLWVRNLPPDRNHPYGHNKIQFFSSGMEGVLMAFAGMLIIGKTIHSTLTGYALGDITSGIGLILISAVFNGLVGWHLLRVGKQENSLILIADGRHILSDFTTTIASLIGVLGAALTGWLIIDVVAALIAGCIIGREGLLLLRQAFAGLLDEADLETDQRIRAVLDHAAIEYEFRYTSLRHRSDGDRSWIEVVLIFNPELTLMEAHRRATRIENLINDILPTKVTITSHLEPDTPKGANPHGHHEQAI